MAKLTMGIDIKVGPMIADFKCPHCGKVNKKPFKELKPKTTIKCRCGNSFVVKPEKFREIQRSLDNLASRGKRRF